MRRQLILAAGAVAIVGLFAWLLPVRDAIVWLAESARDWGAAGVVLFFVAYVISTVALLPGSLLTMAAGFVYGPAWGLALASPASVAGASAAFLLGRTVLRGWAARRVAASARARAIDAAVGRKGFTLVLLLRLSPVVPFNLLNYALSLTRIPFGAYLVASFIGMLPGTALYVYLGSLIPAAAQIGSPDTTARGTAGTLLYVAGLVATLAVVVVATRVARRALAAEMEDSRP